MNISDGDQRTAFTVVSAAVVAEHAASWAGLTPAWAPVVGDVLILAAVVLAIVAAAVRDWYR